MSEETTTSKETLQGHEAVAAVKDQDAPTPAGYGYDANLDYGVDVQRETTTTVTAKDKPKRTVEQRLDKIENTFRMAHGLDLDQHPELDPDSWHVADRQAAEDEQKRKDAAEKRAEKKDAKAEAKKDDANKPYPKAYPRARDEA